MSLLRTFVLLSGALLVLPRLMGVDGVWLSVPLAEGIMALISAGALAGHARRAGGLQKKRGG